MKTVTKREIPDRTRFLIGITLGIIAIAIVSIFAGGVFFSSTVTEASTTYTSTQVITTTYSNVSSFTMTSIVIRTTPTYVTITQVGPDTVTVSGSVTSRTPGTSPTDIIFVSANSNATQFSAKVSNNQYSQVLPDRDSYNVVIVYGTAVANIGAGRCNAGGLILYTLDASLVSNWSC